MGTKMVHVYANLTVVDLEQIIYENTRLWQGREMENNFQKSWKDTSLNTHG